MFRSMYAILSTVKYRDENQLRMTKQTTVYATRLTVCQHGLTVKPLCGVYMFI